MASKRGVPREKRGRRVRTGERSEAVLAQALTWSGGALAGFIAQHPYALPRMLRADFAWVEARLLVEVQGGVFTGQAHGSVSGILADNDRLNTATLGGWRLLRFTTRQIEDDQIAETLDVIERALAVRP